MIADQEKTSQDRREEKSANREVNGEVNREVNREVNHEVNREVNREPPKPKKSPKYKYQAAFNKKVREEKRFYCEFCGTACSKPNELKKHFETRKHARNSCD